MKYLIIVLLFLCNFFCLGQSTDPIECKVHDYYYADSANGEQAICQSKPSAIISFPDGSIIVSSILSVNFPNQYKSSTLANDDYEEYLSKQENYRSKTHNSSGTLFKLDSTFTRQWELIFKEERIIDILIRSDSNILVIGERTDMTKTWIACLSQDGETLWKKYYKKRRQSGIASVNLDSLDNVYVLIESKKMIPFQLKKHTQNKLHFFETSEINDLYLMKLDRDGELKWSKTIDKRKNVQVYGSQVFIAKDQIFVSYSHIGPEVSKDGSSYLNSKKLLTFNSEGRFKESKTFDKRTILGFKNGLLSCSSYHGDTLRIYRNDTLLNSILLPANIDHYWIINAAWVENELILFGSIDHNLGNLLIGLSSTFEMNWYWTNNSNKKTQPADFALYKPNTILFLSEAWSYSNNARTGYISIYEVVKKCTTQLR